ncbi:MAG TPA: hypothetical protein VHH91_07135 [Vicinamibacterales bacterium]|nr:hypothetical protein [Vicinamibacterales bacterium]
MATIASLLRDRVTLRVRSVDRLFLQAYVPKLMTSFQVVRFLLDRGHRIPSPVLLGRIGRAYVEAIDRFATRNAIPVLRFGKGEVKEQIARRYFRAAERDGRFGVVLIGVAQEKAMAWRGWRRGGPDGHPHFEFGRQQVFVNHYYFYVRDPDWGPGFIKTCPYAPFPAWVYVNGHEWAKRQAEKAGLEFEALDNGFRSVADAEALAAICNRLSARDVQRFYRRWEARLPSPLSAEDRRRGYRHQLAFRQLELSDTRVFDRPGAGRAWFEQTLRDQLTLGRPDQVAVVFGRRVSRQTPGRFHTRIINRGTEPAIQVHYRASKVKQYLKEGRALRTETTVNDTRDFGVGRLLTSENWDALVRVGHDINQRLLDAQLQACACAPDAATLERVVLPSSHDGQPAPGLRFGDPRVMALLASLCAFGHLLEGITNRSLRTRVAGLIPGYTARQMTYDLRRLRRKGLIERQPRTRRYTLTADGRRLAVFFTKTYTRIVCPSLAELDPHLPEPIARRTPLGRPWREFEHALDQRIADAALTA